MNYLTMGLFIVLPVVGILATIATRYFIEEFYKYPLVDESDSH